MLFLALSLLSGCTKELPLDEFCEIVAPEEGSCAAPAFDTCIEDLTGKSNACRGCWLGSVSFEPLGEDIPGCSITRDTICDECTASE